MDNTSIRRGPVAWVANLLLLIAVSGAAIASDEFPLFKLCCRILQLFASGMILTLWSQSDRLQSFIGSLEEESAQDPLTGLSITCER